MSMTQPVPRDPRHLTPTVIGVSVVGVVAACALGYRSLFTMSDRAFDVVIRLLSRR